MYQIVTVIVLYGNDMSKVTCILKRIYHVVWWIGGGVEVRMKSLTIMGPEIVVAHELHRL